MPSIITRLRSWLSRSVAPSPPTSRPPVNPWDTPPSEPVVLPARRREKGMIVRTGDKNAADDKNAALREGLQGKGGYGWASDHGEETDAYQGWVAVAVSTLVKSAGESTVVVEQMVDEDADDDQELDRKKVPAKHPLMKLLRRPNPAYGWDGLIKRIVMQRALTGSAFVWMVPSEEMGPQGPPCELYVIPTCLVLYAPPTHAMPWGAYRVSSSSILSIWGGFSGRFGLAMGGWHVIDARHMLRISHIHPKTELDGMSPVHLNRVQIDVTTQAEEMIWHIIQNGAYPSTVLSIAPNAAANGDAVRAAIAEAQRMIEEEYSGSDRAGKVLPLYGVTVNQLTRSLVEAVPPEFRIQNRDNVLAMYQTPATVAGLSETSSYSGLHASRQQYIDNSVQPELTEVGSLLTVQLADRYWPGLIVVVEAKPVNDIEMQMKEHQDLEQSQIITVDEARKRRGMGPHPNPEIGKLSVGAVVAFHQSHFGIGPRGGQHPEWLQQWGQQQPGEGPPAGGGDPSGGTGGGDPGQPAAPSLPTPMRQNMPVHSLDELMAYRTKGYTPPPRDHFPFDPVPPGE